MTTRAQALEQEIAVRMEQVAAMAEAAESGQAGAETKGLTIIHEIEHLGQELAFERTRAEMPR